MIIKINKYNLCYFFFIKHLSKLLFKVAKKAPDMPDHMHSPATLHLPSTRFDPLVPSAVH